MTTGMLNATVRWYNDVKGNKTGYHQSMSVVTVEKGFDNRLGDSGGDAS